MGQYYYCVLLAEDGKYIRAWLDPLAHNNGMKLMEHSYIKNNFMLAVESNLGPNGAFYMTRVVWAGDYAEPEPDSENNLNTMTMDSKQKAIRAGYDTREYRYIINHSKGLYIDKKSLRMSSGVIIHPLSLLTAEGNGNGGGDYRGPNEDMCGIWARDIISVNDSVPLHFEPIVPEFSLDD
jgi:hypothetical protein